MKIKFIIIVFFEIVAVSLAALGSYLASPGLVLFALILLCFCSSCLYYYFNSL